MVEPRGRPFSLGKPFSFQLLILSESCVSVPPMCPIEKGFLPSVNYDFFFVLIATQPDSCAYLFAALTLLVRSAEVICSGPAVENCQCPAAQPRSGRTAVL